MNKIEERITNKILSMEKEEIEKLCKTIFSRFYVVKVAILRNKRTDGEQIEYVLNISKKNNSDFDTLEYLAAGNPNTTGETLDSIGRKNLSVSEAVRERVSQHSNVYDKTLKEMLSFQTSYYGNIIGAIWIVVNAYKNANASDETKRRAAKILKELDKEHLINED